MRTLLQVTALSVSLCMGSLVHAHFVWVTLSSEQVHVHFSESAETPDPELLKNIATAKTWAVVPGDRGDASMVDVPLTLTETSLSGQFTKKASSIVVSHDYGVVSKGDSTFLLKYLAKQHVSPLPGKWSAVKDAEKLPLEITPSWQGRFLVLTVTSKGQPAPDVEVKASGCGLDESLKTDQNGVARCEPQKNGILSVRAKVVEEISGELNGEKYDSILTYSTLTLPVTLPETESVPHTIPGLPHAITSFGAAIVDDTLYVYGGHFGDAHHYSESGQSNEFRRISLTAASGEWESLQGGPKLTGLALVSYQNKLYRIGGFTAKNTDAEDQNLWSQDNFASYDPATGMWTELPALPSGRSSHDAAILNGKLYVVGGWNMEGPDKTTWHTSALVCDLTQEVLAWQELPAPPFQRRALSLAAWKDKLYVIGGMMENGETTTEVAIYDPVKLSWSSAPSLNGTGMEGFGTSSFAAHDRLVVTTMSGSVQTLADDGSRWLISGQAMKPRFFHRQLTTSDGRILVVGGASMETGKINSLELMKFSAK